MHSLTDVCSIVLYTGTHIGTNDVPICRNAAVRLIIDSDIIVIWRENLLHSGAKSRSKHPSKTNRQASGLSPIILDEQCTTSLRFSVSDNHEVKEDLRFFAYVKAAQKKEVTRSKDRVPTSDGGRIYRLLNNFCEDLHNQSECKNCSEGAKVIDLSNITGYQIGETIIGNLDLCEWVVLRGVEFSDEVKHKIQIIATKGKWNSISTGKTDK